ncbi:MAG: repressor LexA [Leptolyngbyaceae cyanobacterium SL_7_1]|nr:repressor LexA [Leptolyngbyaceae cyanobacterium SL_7_1]
MESLTDVQQRLLNWLEEYIFQYGYSPSIQQMREAIGWKSPSTVQRHLKVLREKGWLSWTGSRSRAYQFNHPKVGVIPILGTISAHSLTEVFPEQEAKHVPTAGFAPFKHMSTNERSACFALRVIGDSMIGALIDNGDIVILKPPADQKAIRNGAIVAARVEGKTTLKYFYRTANTVTLKPANPMYAPTEVDASEVDVQGVYIGLMRNLL